MNKERMSIFLKDLRKEKGLNQEDIRMELIKYGIFITKKAISDYETGKAIPEIEKLNALSLIYNVSIDEILDGERISYIDYSKEYFLLNLEHIDEYQSLEIEERNDIINNQVIKINARFNELLFLKITDYLTTSNDNEFKFLFLNFYKLSDYRNANDYSCGDDYLKLLKAIDNTKKENKNLSVQELLWEIKKYILPSDIIIFPLEILLTAIPIENSSLDKRFKSLEPFEKDMLLMSLQKYNTLILSGAKPKSETINSIKNVIKYMISNGASLNSQYLNFRLRKVQRARYIDRLEYLYNLFVKPITGTFNKDSMNYEYKVANNTRNLFISHYYNLICPAFNYKIDELYNLILQNDYITKDMIINSAIKHNINLDQEYSKIVSDLTPYISKQLEYIAEFKRIEEERKSYKEEYDLLLTKINNGETTYEYIHEEFIGGETINELKDCFYFWNRFVNKKEFNKSRLIGETSNLLNEIDVLPFEEIFDKYFKEEIREDINS